MFFHSYVELKNQNKQAKGKNKTEEERHKPRNRLLTVENKLMATRGDADGGAGGGGWVK